MALKVENRTAWAFSRKAATGGAQLALEPGEVHLLNPVPPGVRILSGTAWMTWKGEDIVLDQGQQIRFSSGGDKPMISPVGSQTLVVEMLHKSE
jgi:hypothetical protein